MCYLNTMMKLVVCRGKINSSYDIIRPWLLQRGSSPQKYMWERVLPKQGLNLKRRKPELSKQATKERSCSNSQNARVATARKQWLGRWGIKCSIQCVWENWPVENFIEPLMEYGRRLIHKDTQADEKSALWWTPETKAI